MGNLEEQYTKDGFVVMEEIIPLQAIESLREAAQAIVQEFDSDQHRSVFSTRDKDKGRDQYFVDSAESVHCFLEEEALDKQGHLVQPKDSAINKIGHAMHDLDPVFQAFCRQPILADILKQIGYQSPLLWQTMYIFKQARIGGEVRWHQDASYLISSPTSVVGFWVALEDAHRDNGCLWVQPGGHRTPLREIYEFDHASGHGELHSIDNTAWPDESEALAVEVPKGSLVIFNDHMPHYSSPNRSSASRQAFTMHFAEENSTWSEKNWLQRPSLGPFKL
jgi:phytanoyl-CoA hydroxylase